MNTPIVTGSDIRERLSQGKDSFLQESAYASPAFPWDNWIYYSTEYRSNLFGLYIRPNYGHKRSTGRDWFANWKISSHYQSRPAKTQPSHNDNDYWTPQWSDLKKTKVKLPVVVFRKKKMILVDCQFWKKQLLANNFEPTGNYVVSIYRF